MATPAIKIMTGINTNDIILVFAVIDVELCFCLLVFVGTVLLFPFLLDEAFMQQFRKKEGLHSLL